MKTLLLTLLFFSAAPLFADSITSGSLGLLKPSTNTVDPTRSWADKLNKNFDMIAATITGIITVPGEPTSFTLFKDTAQAKIATISQDTGTLFINLRSTAVSFSNFMTFNATNTNLTSSTNTWTASQTATSSPSWKVYGATWGIGSMNIIWQTTPTLGTPGQDIPYRDRVSSAVVWGIPPSAGAAGASVQNSTEVLRFGYSGSLNISTSTICGWLVACFNTMESTYNVMGIMASVVEGSSVASTIFNLVVATNSAISPLMASTTYFPTINITTRASAGQQQVRIATGSAGVAPGGVPPPIVILPWSTIGVLMSTMPTSGDLPRGLKIGINAWTVR